MCQHEPPSNVFGWFQTERTTLSEIIAELLSSTHTVDGLTEPDLITLVDTLQELIETNDTNRRTFEKHLRKLVSKHGIFPSNLFVQGVQRIGKNPATGGGFADIWRGQVKNQIVALKVLRIFDWSANQSKLFKEFCTEAMTWRQLDHPNVLPFLGICTYEFHPRHAMVSPWMPNGDLLKFLKTDPKCDRLQLMYGVTCGLSYLHSLIPTIIHGDLRAANVLIDENGQPRLADFGLSRVIDSQASLVSTNSQKGRGNVRWQAPELLDPASFEGETGNVTTRSDIYSLACLFLEIFTGDIPFAQFRIDGAVVFEVVGKRAQPLRPQEPAGQRGLNDHIWTMMQRCWSFQPSERPDAKTIINELAYLEHSQIPPEKPCIVDEEAYRKLFRILLESEREYVFTLQRLQRSADAKLLYESEEIALVRNLLYSVESLLNHHQELLNALEMVSNLPLSQHRLGNSLIQTASNSALYVQYIEYFTMFMNTTSRSRSTDTRDSPREIMVSEWFKLLLKPVYRLYVYRMLSESFSCLPLAEVDLEDFRRGRASLQSAITIVENAQVMMDLKWRVKKWRSIKQSKLGDLILDGLVLVSRRGALMRCHAFLFHNILLLCASTSASENPRQRRTSRKFLKFLTRVLKSPALVSNTVSDRSLNLKAGIHLHNIQSVSLFDEHFGKNQKTLEVCWKRESTEAEQSFTLTFRSEIQSKRWNVEMNKLLEEAEAEGTSLLIKRNGSVQSSSSFVDVEDGAFESDLAFYEAQLAYATDNKLIHDIRASWASAELKAAY